MPSKGGTPEFKKSGKKSVFGGAEYSDYASDAQVLVLLLSNCVALSKLLSIFGLSLFLHKEE